MDHSAKVERPRRSTCFDSIGRLSLAILSGFAVTPSQRRIFCQLWGPCSCVLCTNQAFIPLPSSSCRRVSLPVQGGASNGSRLSTLPEEGIAVLNSLPFPQPGSTRPPQLHIPANDHATREGSTGRPTSASSSGKTSSKPAFLHLCLQIEQQPGSGWQLGGRLNSDLFARVDCGSFAFTEMTWRPVVLIVLCLWQSLEHQHVCLNPDHTMIRILDHTLTTAFCLMHARSAGQPHIITPSMKNFEFELSSRDQ